MKHISLDMENWDRYEHFKHFKNIVPCTYSLTAKIDISELLIYKNKKNFNFYPIIIHCITKAVNQQTNFRISYDHNNNLGYYDYLNPSYTIFHKETETFSNIWTDYDDDINVFIKLYNKDIDLYGNNFSLSPKGSEDSNLLNISSLPWVDFSSFNLNLQKGYEYYLPIITIGKFTKLQRKWYMPLAIQIHHAVADGYHISVFLKTLQSIIDRINM